MGNFKDIKAVFLDVDGTLTNSNKQITEATRIPIKAIKDKGIYVILCSGRSNRDVCKYSKDVCASDYTISSNGAQIYNCKTNSNFYKNNIEYNEIEKLWEYCNRHNLELVLNVENEQIGNNIFCSNMYSKRSII